MDEIEGKMRIDNGKAKAAKKGKKVLLQNGT
jgi:hypothetical protein